MESHLVTVPPDALDRRADGRSSSAAWWRSWSTATSSSASSRASISQLAAPELDEQMKFDTKVDPRRAGARSAHRRGDDADLRHLDLRAVEPGRAQGLRLRPHAQPDARCARSLPRRRSKAATPAFAFASGMAAIGTVLELLDTGSHVVVHATTSTAAATGILERVRKRSAGLQASFVDLSDTRALEAAIRPNTRMVWVETPTNPLLKIVDLAAVARAARERGHHLRCATTPSPRPGSSGRSSTASTSSCTRPPST